MGVAVWVPQLVGYGIQEQVATWTHGHEQILSQKSSLHPEDFLSSVLRFFLTWNNYTPWKVGH